MSNNKANRVSFIGNGNNPPLFNLSKNTPWVSTDFRSVEKNNAPFLNEMLQPLWLETINNDSVYDREGNRYYIENGNLYRNDKLINTVANKMFIKEDVTEEFIDYLSFDIHNGQLATLNLVSDDTGNRAALKYGSSTYTSTKLFIHGNIITSRVRVVNDKPVAVIVYRDDNNNLMMCVLSDTVNNARAVTWRTQTIRPKTSDSYTPQIVGDILRVYPLINIASLDSGYIGISIISNYSNLVMATDNPEFNEGIMTLLIAPDNTIYEYGVDLLPSTGAPETETITATYTNYFKFNYANTASYTLKTTININGSWYEWENNTLGNELVFETQTPVNAGYKITYSGIEYNVYYYYEFEHTNIISVVSQGPAIDNTTTWAVRVNGTSYDMTGYTSKAIEYTYTDLSQDATPPASILVQWYNEWSDVPIEYWYGNNIYSTSRTETTTTQVGTLTHPNTFLDSGEMFAFYTFNYASTQSKYAAGKHICETAHLNVASNKNAYTWTSVEEGLYSITDPSIESISVGVAQNFYTKTVRLGDVAFTTTNASSGNYIEYNNTNCSDLRYNPGTQNTPSWSYYNKGAYSSGNPDMQLVYTPGGWRTALANSHWNILVNTTVDNETYPWGISYSNSDNDMGTLLTEWQSIDENFYVVADNDICIYRDQANRYWKLSVVDGNKLFAIIEDRYIIVNTTSYWNCYDSKFNKLTHIFSDYNGRVMEGTSSINSAETSVGTNAIVLANGINVSISDENDVSRDNDRISSILIPSRYSYRAITGSEKAFKCNIPYSTNANNKGIDIYYSAASNVRANNRNDTDLSTCKYQYTIYPYADPSTVKKFELQGTSYRTSSNILLSPDLFSRFINGAGNNDFIVEETTSYPLVYWNSQPMLLYNPAGMIEGAEAFFVLQGQYYAVVNNKIYSVIYSNGGISEMDAIIDIKGYKFLGNTPSIAFFWCDALRAIFSFTGDANMSKIFNASKFADLYLNKNGVYFYDEASQSIYIPTNEGLLVIGTNNTYMLPKYKNIRNIQHSTDGITHIMDNGNTYNLSYYKLNDEQSSNHVILETSFFGLGETEVSTIDRWSITLYCPNDKWVDNLVLRVSSLTDAMVNSEEKTFKITTDMWDKNSNAVLINYNPKLIKGQGIRLYIDSPWIVQSIVPHIADQGHSTQTRYMT